MLSPSKSASSPAQPACLYLCGIGPLAASCCQDRGNLSLSLIGIGSRNPHRYSTGTYNSLSRRWENLESIKIPVLYVEH